MARLMLRRASAIVIDPIAQPRSTDQSTALTTSLTAWASSGARSASGSRNVALVWELNSANSSARVRIRRPLEHDVEAEELRQPLERRQHPAHQVVEHPRRVVAGERPALDPELQGVAPHHHHGGEEVLLGGEVAVHRAERDVGLLGDVAHLDLVVLALLQEPQGRRHDAVSPRPLARDQALGRRGS